MRGSAPAAVKLPGITGGRDSVDKEEVRTPIQLPPVENTGAELKKESSDGETTEINRNTNGGSGQRGGGAPTDSKLQCQNSDHHR